MVDQSLVTSGFDIEVLLSERFLSYVFLAQVEAGRLALEYDIVDGTNDIHVTIHPPTDYDRLYPPHSDAVLPPADANSFIARLRFNDPAGANLEISVIVDLVDNVSGSSRIGGQFDLFLVVALLSDVDADGRETDHRLSIELVDLEVDNTSEFLIIAAGMSVDDVEALLKPLVDREVPFGMAGNGGVERVVMATHEGGAGVPDALGVYLNLALRSGPNAGDLLGTRGDVGAAGNFLEGDRDLAFATAHRLWDRLGEDAFFRRAEPDAANPGRFIYPIRSDPLDDASDVVAVLKGITIGPELGPLDPTGRLLIDVFAQATPFGLPFFDFHFLIYLDPQVSGGEVTWVPEVKVDVELFCSPASYIAIVAAAVIFAPLGPWGLALIPILIGADLLTDAVVTGLAAGAADDHVDASFLDALPHHLEVARRRWDPLYNTGHEVVTVLTAVTVNRSGIAFDGRASLGTRLHPVTHAVIRDEQRGTSGQITRLRYRVRDLDNIAADLVAIAPGTDRRQFARVEDDAEPLVSLTLNQIGQRIGSGRIIHPIVHLPQRIHLRNNTIDSLLVVSRQEVREQVQRLIDDFEARAESLVRMNELAAITATETDRLLADLGRDPTADELTEAIDARVDERGAELSAGYRPPRHVLDAALSQILRFDLAPAEFVDLQAAGILAIQGKVPIAMSNGTRYLRDRADGIRSDNLRSLRRYQLPYVPE